MHVPSATETTTLDQRARVDVPIHQWTLPGGALRGVKVQALTFKDAMLAEKAATEKDGKVNGYRLIAEEVVRGVYDPPGLTLNHILDWNTDVVLYVNNRIREISGFAAAVLAAELARIAAGPPPEPAPHRGAGNAGADDLGGDAGASPWAADDEPGGPDDPGSADGDRPPPVGDGDRDGQRGLPLAGRQEAPGRDRQAGPLAE
jgi:hypothetical protein